MDEHYDRVPQGIIEYEYDYRTEKGYNSEDFMDVCSVFVMTNLYNEKLSDSQQ